MYDIQDLENKWRRYKRKKLQVWYLIVTITLLISFLSISLINNKSFFIKYVKEIELFTKKNSSDQKEEDINRSKIGDWLLEDALLKLEIEPKKKIVKVIPVKKTIIKVVKIPVAKIKKTTPQPIYIPQPIVTPIVIKEKKSIKKRVKLNIIQTNSLTSYKMVEKRFKRKKNIDDAIFLAEAYYKKRKYKKAKYWALESNKLDSNVEESLIIFAKAKYKLGRKEEGMAILKAYLQKSNSRDATQILYKMRKNRL